MSSSRRRRPASGSGADRADEAAGVGDERDRLVKQLDEERAEEDKLERGRANAARLLALGDLTREEFRTAKAAADARRGEVAERVADLQARLDALAPDRDVYDRVERGAEGTTPEAWAALLRRIIRSVAVTPEAVTLMPWRGEPFVWDRSELTPRRPHRGERETPHGLDGRFVARRAAAGGAASPDDLSSRP